MCYKVRNISTRNLNQQLALPLTFKVLKNRENFLVSKCNELAVKLIENSEAWQSRKKINAIPAILIYGPKACGKTHLSYIFRQYNDCIYLASLSNDDLELIEKGKIFILDDFAPGLKYPAELVMHFLNQVTYNEEFIDKWLQSPQTSLYYSLQVMGDTQDKSDAYAALKDSDIEDYLSTILNENEPQCDCAE